MGAIVDAGSASDTLTLADRARYWTRCGEDDLEVYLREQEQEEAERVILELPENIREVASFQRPDDAKYLGLEETPSRHRKVKTLTLGRIYPRELWRFQEERYGFFNRKVRCCPEGAAKIVFDWAIARGFDVWIERTGSVSACLMISW